jgi:hypothetical protein
MRLLCCGRALFDKYFLLNYRHISYLNGVNIMPPRFFRIFLFISFLSLFIGHVCAVTEEEENLMEHMRKYFCPSLQFKKELIEKGFNYLGNLDTLPTSELFKKGIALRNGKVNGLEDVTVERLIFQYICFKNVRIFEENLHLRAMHNQASTIYMLGDELKKLPNAKDYNKQILPIVYQEAWYLFSLVDFAESKNNLKKLRKENLIDFVIGNPELEKKFGKSSCTETLKNVLKQQEEKIIGNLRELQQETNTLAGKMVAKIFEEELRSNLEKTKAEILSEPYHLILERTEEKEPTEKETPDVKPIVFNHETFSDLARLFNQLIVNVKTTPPFSSEEPKPVTVFIGRSISWLSVMQQYLEDQLPKDMQFKHALISGLRREPLSSTEKENYKEYLDSLGFDTLDKSTPLLITDVVETGTSLQRYGEDILKPLYGFTNIQYLAMMFPWQTIDLERARVIYVTDRLARIMFAKHQTNTIYCPFSPLYPSQWSQWEIYTQSFRPHLEALKLKNQLEEWLESSEGREKIAPVIGFANVK